MNIDVGNIVRLKKTFKCNKYYREWINVIDRTPLQVIATGHEKDVEWCLVSGNGFNLRTECNNLIKIKEKGDVPTTLLKV